MIDYHLTARPRGLERPERDPEGVLDFWAEDNRRPRRQREYKRTDDDRWKHRCARMKIVENPQSLGMRKIDAHFFHGFTDRGRQEIGIGGVAPAAGKRNLSRPRVADTHGTMNEQRFDASVAIVQNHGDGRGNHPRLERNLSGSIVS